jgi:transcription elongation factor GreA
LAHARSAAGLLAGVGLLADGPVVWGRPVPSRKPGVFIVELSAPLAKAPIELTKVGKWVERVETLRLDGERPVSKAVAARLAAFWLPNETVLYVGVSTASIGGRVAALYQTVLGDRRPHSGGHWLKTFVSLDGLRIWWAETSAPEEYEDGLLSAFGDGVDPETRAALPDTTVVLPFANLQTPTGERKAHGLSGYLLPDPSAGAAAPPRRVVEVAEGDAEGASREVKGGGTLRTPRKPIARAPRASGTRSPVRSAAATAPVPGSAAAARLESVDVTAETLDRMKTEVHQLTHVKRPEVVARIKSARELGDLKENAEYHAAREEQSFLEGRIQLLEQRIRQARVIEAPSADESNRVHLGSTVVVEHDGERMTFTVVGSAEAEPAKGRISASSPVGGALLGHEAGDDVEVRTPRGPARYRIVSLG